MRCADRDGSLSLTDVRELTIDDTLDGEDVLPGFRCVLRGVLE